MGRRAQEQQAEIAELDGISRLPAGQARDRRVDAFLRSQERLVRHIARQWAGAGDRDDVEQVVRWGLWDAVRRWIPGRAKTFGSYAVTQVRARIKVLRLAQPLVRIPESDHKTLRLLRRLHANPASVDPRALAALAGLSELNVRIALEQAARPRAAVALEDSDQAAGRDYEALLIDLLDAVREPEAPVPSKK
jgi:DNA-directed RNA polymerase specialized sigma subunit